MAQRKKKKKIINFRDNYARCFMNVTYFHVTLISDITDVMSAISYFTVRKIYPSRVG